MKTILLLSVKEVREGLRNRWVVAATGLLAALALTLTFLGSAPTGTVGAGALDVVVISLASLTIFIVPLIALLISHDAIVGEIERGTMTLLLSYPVRRRQVLFGKFMGHLAILAFATCVGYGLAAIALLVTGKAVGAGSWAAFMAMTASSVLLGAVFVAIGYLVSALVADRATAGGVAIGIWLVFVVLYDMALLGLLVADQGRAVSGGTLDALLLFNPTDAYRLFNLAGSGNIAAASGMAGTVQTAVLAPAALLAALAAWVVAPMALAALVFSRREL
ncbi:ABC transporter permease subunit [Ollibium composti]|jgi:Cu-processing system permease protein|uniref:ABC transporter permease n=1 Tax=Ollibium composti TaxID=2675109 RepID=A0ABY2Q396_9HYPH|nr:ABC transporter permease subunit [Mesorhizobium composti]THF55510.1 ABC transporter permease [Mesorhizobium composti]